MSFLDFCFSSSWGRERESGIQNLGIKEKCPQSYLSYFSMVFHWRIFLLSRANRLCSIFLHWLEEPGVLPVSGILLSSTRNTGYGSSAHYGPCSKTHFLIIYFRWGEEVPTSVLGSQPIIWLLSSSFLGVRRPEVTKYQHLVSPVWPTFLPNGHSLTARYCYFKHGRIVLILPLSSLRDITWQCGYAYIC